MSHLVQDNERLGRTQHVSLLLAAAVLAAVEKCDVLGRTASCLLCAALLTLFVIFR